MAFNPHQDMLGGYSPNDGTVEFYSRINSIANQDWTLLDLGAGRAEWFEDGKSSYKVSLQLMKGKFKKVIAVDVSDAVLKNRACDERIQMHDGIIPVPDESVDVVIADWVLEHIEHPMQFRNEVNRILKPGGYFFARTPHGVSYLSIAARLVPNRLHARVLRGVQPDRKPEDVFPTFYRMNTLTSVNKLFSEYRNFSYLFRPNPAYFFGSKFIYQLQTVLHRLLPTFLYGFVYVFVQKPSHNSA
jgi:ubiquinone/menaquinone biosynthesis C-methylase UbiE